MGVGGSACSPLGDGDEGSGSTELLVRALGRPLLSAVTNGASGPFPDPTVSMATTRSVPQPPRGDPQLEATVGPGPGGHQDPPRLPPGPSPTTSGCSACGRGQGETLVSQAPLANCS